MSKAGWSPQTSEFPSPTTRRFQLPQHVEKAGSVPPVAAVSTPKSHEEGAPWHLLLSLSRDRKYRIYCLGKILLSLPQEAENGVNSTFSNGLVGFCCFVLSFFFLITQERVKFINLLLLYLCTEPSAPFWS